MARFAIIPLFISLFAAPALAREAPGTGRELLADVGASLDVSVDVLGIAEAIKAAIADNADRTAFVKNLCNTAFYAPENGQKYNVMTFNLQQDYSDSLNSVKFYASSVYDGITYGIWAFQDGSFTNNGDGGYINWCFQGAFTRSGDQGHDVTFTALSK